MIQQCGQYHKLLSHVMAGLSVTNKSETYGEKTGFVLRSFWVIPRRQRAGNYTEESIKHSESGESLKSRKRVLIYAIM
jgi:hypothetical protein